MKRRTTMGLLLLGLTGALVAPLPGAPSADAQQPAATTIKIATLFPQNSSLMRTLQAWGQTVRQSSGGRVALEFVSRPRTTAESAIVNDLKANTVQGAVLTSSGLSGTAPGALALTAPGAIADYARLDAVRTSLRSELEAAFTNGADGQRYKLVGWADYGRARIFSKTALAAPNDLRGRKLWVAPGDAASAALAAASGATPVAMGVGGVAAALDSGAIDTVYASPVAVVSLNWHREGRLRHVSSQTFGVVVGATVLRQSAFDSIPADYRQQFMQEAAQAHTLLNRTIRRDDDRNYTTATGAGVTEFSTAAQAAAWNTLMGNARGRFTGPAATLVPRVR